MVVIRLARVGKKKQAFYRIVVADSKRFVKSKSISVVGWYNPLTKEINLKKEEISDWLKKGAQPSNTVAVLLKNNGVKLPDWVKIAEKVSKPKKEVPEVKEVKAEVSVETKEEAVEAAKEITEEAKEEPTAEETNSADEKKEELDIIEEKAAEEASKEKTEK